MARRSRAPTIVAVLAAALALVGLSACGEKAEPDLDQSTTEARFEITGRWAGELRQQGMEPFNAQATIASLARSKQNTVHYTGIDCSGTWNYLGASATAYRFQETIDRGAGAKCKGTGDRVAAPALREPGRVHVQRRRRREPRTTLDRR